MASLGESIPLASNELIMIGSSFASRICTMAKLKETMIVSTSDVHLRLNPTQEQTAFRSLLLFGRCKLLCRFAGRLALYETLALVSFRRDAGDGFHVEALQEQLLASRNYIKI